MAKGPTFFQASGRKPQAAGTDDPATLVAYELPDMDEDEWALVAKDLEAHRAKYPRYRSNAEALMEMLDMEDYLPGHYQ